MWTKGMWITESSIVGRVRGSHIIRLILRHECGVMKFSYMRIPYDEKVFGMKIGSDRCIWATGSNNFEELGVSCT